MLGRAAPCHRTWAGVTARRGPDFGLILFISFSFLNSIISLNIH
jgi:hypothetical protein